SFDVRLAHYLTAQITLGIDAYYCDNRNLQDESQFGNALIFSAFNYERGKIYGVELSASYRHNGLSAYANIANAVAKGKTIETGQFNFDPDELDYINNNWVHLDHDQHWSASAGAAYTWSGTTLSGDLIYGSGLRRGFANTEHLPSYTTVNVALTQAFSLPSVGKLEGRLS